MDRYFPPNRPLKYPVINDSPKMDDVINNFNARDIAVVTTSILTSSLIGWKTGGPARKPAAFFFGFLGAFGGSFLAMQNSYGRLTGTKAPEQIGCLLYFFILLKLVCIYKYIVVSRQNV